MELEELSQEQLEQIDSILDHRLLTLGVNDVILLDTAGNVVTTREGSHRVLNDSEAPSVDPFTLSALAAGNFSTTEAIAQAIGETEFDLLFHKGRHLCVHYGKIANALILVTIFSSEIALGSVRLNVQSATNEILMILKQPKQS